MGKILKQIEVSIQVDVYEADTFFLREARADGQLGVRDFELSTNMYGQGTLVRFDKDEWYLFSPEAIVKGLSKAIEQEHSNAGDAT